MERKRTVSSGLGNGSGDKKDEHFSRSALMNHGGVILANSCRLRIPLNL